MVGFEFSTILEGNRQRGCCFQETQIELTWKLHIPTFYTGSFQNNVNMSSRIRLSMFSMRILYRQKLFDDQDEDCRIARKGNWSSLPSCRMIKIADSSRVLYFDPTKNWKFKFERIALSFTKHEKTNKSTPIEPISSVKSNEMPSRTPSPTNKREAHVGDW